MLHGASRSCLPPSRRLRRNRPVRSRLRGARECRGADQSGGHHPLWLANAQATNCTLYRKTRDATSWGTATALATNATSYVDSNVSVGSAYEYRISRTAWTGKTNYSSEGYIYAGITVPLTESRGKIILLVDNTIASSLSRELERLQLDLVGDGWTVLRHDVARDDSVPSVKNLIKSDYIADPGNVKALFLLGHVPVPYSGDIYPDGHTNHWGAWPADVYYGEMNSTWTDSSVNDVSDRAAPFPYLRALPFSQSKQEEFLEWVELLARREGSSPAALLSRTELTNPLSDQALDPQEKSPTVRQILKTWIFPALTAAREAFQRRLDRLGLTRHPRLHLSPPPAFEGPDFLLSVKFQDADELRKLLEELARLAAQEDFSRLMAL